mgnify:CR=1 FL=1
MQPGETMFVVLGRPGCDVFVVLDRSGASLGSAGSVRGCHLCCPSPQPTVLLFVDCAHAPAAAGMVPLQRRGIVMIYVHRNVPSVQVDMFTPWKLQQLLLKEFPPSRVAWYSVPEAALWGLTMEKLRSLKNQSASLQYE